ncbi:MAG: WYL domain-containing protein [Clostridia bacterium]|nr:WYL domain-containing protein [Clostridia bacterium]
MADGSLSVRIMEILWHHTDQDHPLSQKEIRELLRREHGIDVKPKVLRRLLSDLAEYRDEIKYHEHRRVSGGQESMLRSGFYLLHPFTEPELQQILDSVQANHALSTARKADLAGRIGRMGNLHFRSRASQVSEPRSVWILEQAVRMQKYIAADFPVSGDGVRSFVRRHFQPLLMSTEGGRHFVTCRFEDGTVMQQSISELHDVRIFDAAARKLSSEKPARPCSARFSVKRSAIGSIRSQFGDDVSFGSGSDEWLIAIIRAPRPTLLRFALLYSDLAELLQPADLRQAVRKSLQKALAMYAQTEPGQTGSTC